KPPSDTAPKAKRAPKQKKVVETVNSDSDSEFGIPKKTTTPKGKGRGAKKRKASGSENEGDYNPGRKPSKTASKDIPLALMLRRSVIFIKIFGNMWGLLGRRFLIAQKGSYQDVQAGSLEQGDLVCDGQAGEARQTLGELHDLNNALGGQLTEFVPEAQVQSDPVVSTGILRGREKRKGRRRMNDVPPGGSKDYTQGHVYIGRPQTHPIPGPSLLFHGPPSTSILGPNGYPNAD
ncbi:hypothetical protein A6R68_19774, partial [Neotoma lepida]